MKREFLILLVAASGLVAAAQQNVQATYDVQYKLGFIDKSVATADVNVCFNGSEIFGTLSGHTIPWEGRVYSVSDTLQAAMHPTTEVVRYVNGWYTKPEVGQTASLSNPADFRNILGQGTLNASDDTMEAISITANLISVFYYAQTLPFSRMAAGTVVKIPIFYPDGSREHLHLVYNGVGRSCLDDNQFVFKLVANYSYKGQMSDYPVEMEVDTGSLLPTFFSADIAIGHVQMVKQ